MSRSDRQIVAAAFRGKLTKPARDLSPAYVARLAREVRAARAEGRRPTRQAARGHKRRELAPGVVTAREHPAQFVIRDVDGVRRRVSTRRVAPTRNGVIVQREYVDIDAAEAWVSRLPADVAVQVVAHGELRPEYGLDDAQPSDDDEPSDDELDEDEVDDDGEPISAEPAPALTWRSVYTGNAAGDPDENGVDLASGLRAALDRVFLPGSVDRVIVRWQR